MTWLIVSYFVAGFLTSIFLMVADGGDDAWKDLVKCLFCWLLWPLMVLTLVAFTIAEIIKGFLNANTGLDL